MYRKRKNKMSKDKDNNDMDIDKWVDKLIRKLVIYFAAGWIFGFLTMIFCYFLAYLWMKGYII